MRSSTFATAADILRQSASLFEHYFPRPLAIAELANHCHVSPKTLSKVFVGIVGLDKRLFREMYGQDICSFSRSCDPVRQQATSLVPWDEHCDATREIELIIQASGCNQLAPITASSSAAAGPDRSPSKSLVMIR